MNDPMNSHQRNDSRNNLFHTSGYGDSIIAREDDLQTKSVKYYVRSHECHGDGLSAMRISSVSTLVRVVPERKFNFMAFVQWLMRLSLTSLKITWNWVTFSWLAELDFDSISLFTWKIFHLLLKTSLAWSTPLSAKFLLIYRMMVKAALMRKNDG